MLATKSSNFNRLITLVQTDFSTSFAYLLDLADITALLHCHTGPYLDTEFQFQNQWAYNIFFFHSLSLRSLTAQ